MFSNCERRQDRTRYRKNMHNPHRKAPGDRSSFFFCWEPSASHCPTVYVHTFMPVRQGRGLKTNSAFHVCLSCLAGNKIGKRIYFLQTLLNQHGCVFILIAIWQFSTCLYILNIFVRIFHLTTSFQIFSDLTCPVAQFIFHYFVENRNNKTNFKSLQWTLKFNKYIR